MKMDNMVVIILQNRRRNIVNLRIQRRMLRDASNPFTIPEEEFLSLYRLSKEAVRGLIGELEPYMPAIRHPRAVPLELQVLLALNFFASGSYQKRVGQDYLSCVSQSTVSIILHRVVQACNELMREWIKFPTQEQEIQRVKQEYWAHTQFPGVLGAVDGTHIAIVPPESNREQWYINRKLYHSLNVLIVSDYIGKILSVNASHGGRTHDARVWRASLVSDYLQENMQAQQNSWLLGDSAYPLLPYVMTPKLHAAEGSPSARYTQHHVIARSSVERCIGVLKGRWRCLRKERALHYKPEFAALIVNACCVLHNMALSWRLPVVEPYHDELDREQPEQLNDPIANGNDVREWIIEHYFTN